MTSHETPDVNELADLTGRAFTKLKLAIDNDYPPPFIEAMASGLANQAAAFAAAVGKAEPGTIRMDPALLEHQAETWQDVLEIPDAPDTIPPDWKD